MEWITAHKPMRNGLQSASATLIASCQTPPAFFAPSDMASATASAVMAIAVRWALSVIDGVFIAACRQTGRGISQRRPRQGARDGHQTTRCDVEGKGNATSWTRLYQEENIDLPKLLTDEIRSSRKSRDKSRCLATGDGRRAYLGLGPLLAFEPRPM